MIYNYNDFLINEGMNIDPVKLDKVIKKISENIPPKFFEVVDKYKDSLSGMVKKFTTDGIVNVNKLIPLVNVKESINEANGGWFKYIKYLLSKILPIEFFRSIGDLIYDMLIEPFKDGDYLVGAFHSFVTIALGFLIFLMGYLIHMGIDQVFNGMEQGIVKSEVTFEPAHNQVITNTHSNGKSTYTTTTIIRVPDTWAFEVEDFEGKRVEQWKTTDKSEINIEQGDTLNSDDYSWSFTLKK
jgi:hypothetical protein